MINKTSTFYKYRKNIIVSLFFILIPFIYCIINNKVYSDKEYSAFNYQDLSNPDYISISQDELEKHDIFLDCLWNYNSNVLQNTLKYKEKDYVTIPHKYTGQGKASYSIKINGLTPGLQYGLLLPFFKSGCIVLIDDEPLAWLGIPNPNIPDSRAKYKIGLYSFTTTKEYVKISIQTENRYTKIGGISQIPIFGLTENLRNRQIKTILFDIIASLVFFFPSIPFFFLYLKQKRNFLLASAFFFLSLSITFFICSSNTLILQIFPYLPTFILIKITYILLICVSCLLTLIFHFLDTDKRFSHVYTTLLYIQAVILTSIIFWPMKYIALFQSVYLVVIFSICAFFIFRLVLSLFDDKSILSYIIPATVIIFHCFTTNFLYRMQFYKIRSFYPFGYSTSYNPIFYSFETFINIFFECFAFGNLVYNMFKYIIPFFVDSKKLTYKSDKKSVYRIDYINFTQKKYNLTSRETQVLALLLFDSLTYKDISHRLSISENTVKKYVSSILQKTNTESRYELVANFISMEGLSE